MMPAAADTLLQREVTITRLVAAPRALIFAAWTEADQIARWWGPHGFTSPLCEVDARPGGALRIVMCAPDGTDYPMRGTFQAVTPPERLVFTNIAVDADGRPVLNGLTTVTFADEGARTRLTVRTRVIGLVADADRMLDGMDEGWTQSIERLEAHVATRCG